ncbi:MAG: hypothetical protein ABWY81_10895 [Jiangellaceae bacterium]
MTEKMSSEELVAALASALGVELPRAPSDLDDLSRLIIEGNDVTKRIIRRAKYDALKEMLSVLDSWVKGVAENHKALGHRDRDGCEDFTPSDIRNMVNDAARVLGTPSPWIG